MTRLELDSLVYKNKYQKKRIMKRSPTCADKSTKTQVSSNIIKSSQWTYRFVSKKRP